MHRVGQAMALFLARYHQDNHGRFFNEVLVRESVKVMAQKDESAYKKFESARDGLQEARAAASEEALVVEDVHSVLTADGQCAPEALLESAEELYKELAVRAVASILEINEFSSVPRYGPQFVVCEGDSEEVKAMKIIKHECEVLARRLKEHAVNQERRFERAKR